MWVGLVVGTNGIDLPICGNIRLPVRHAAALLCGVPELVDECCFLRFKLIRAEGSEVVVEVFPLG